MIDMTNLTPRYYLDELRNAAFLSADAAHRGYGSDGDDEPEYQAALIAWEKDRAELADLREQRAHLAALYSSTFAALERERMRLAGCSSAALGYHTKSDEIHPDYDSASLQDVMRLRERLAEVVAQRDALVDAAQWAVPAFESGGMGGPIRTALAAIRAEREGRG